MKLDFKSILILILLGATLIFGYKWYFGGNSEYKEKLKALQEQYDEIEKQKSESDKRLIIINNEKDSLSIQDSLSKKRILELEDGVMLAQRESDKSKEMFNKLKAELAITKKKIEDLKNNPPNRTGDELLESIKNKTK